MRVLCPGCDVKLRVSADGADTRISCPKCGERFRPSEADEADDAPKKKGKKAAQGGLSQNAVITIAVGGVVGVIVLGIIVYSVLSLNKATEEGANGKQLQPANNNANGPVPPPPPPNNPLPDQIPSPSPNQFDTRPPNPAPNSPTRPTLTPQQPNRSPLMQELDELFKPVVNSAPPSGRAALLDHSADDAPLDVPTFHSLKVANRPANAKPVPFNKLTLDEIKAATVYIKVDAGELSGTGSGFYIGTDLRSGTALVATNYHVIEAAASKRRELEQGSSPNLEGGLEPGKEPKLRKPPKITLVFNSGESGTEYSSTAHIVGVDPIADLAVLMVDKPGKLPKPIHPWDTPPALTETTEVRICGFPFGGQLATAGDHPNISIGSGTISSLRKNKAGNLEKVQINGAINPGNSGGPIVDKDGRLVGIAVSTLKGAGVGFAVPVNDLIAMLEGRLLLTAFIPDGIEGNAAKFQVLIPIMDPRSQINKAYVRYWAGNGAKPKAVKDPKIGWKAIERAVQVDMPVPQTRSSLTFALGELRLPTDATEVVIQIASETKDGLVAASAPVTYKLNVKDVANGRDARPFTDLVNNADALAGQTVVVRAHILGAFASRDDYQPLIVADTEDRIPSKMIFLADKSTAVQFDELIDDHWDKDVRLTCVIGRRSPTGVVMVRVARADFLNAGNGVVHSIPDAETKDQLAALNRDPVKHLGQRVTFQGAAVPYTTRSTTSNDLLVLFPSLNRPRNLTFVAAKGLMQKILDAELKMNGLYKVRIDAKVDGNTPASGTRMQVTVTKIEILDTKGDTVLKTIE